MNAGPEGTPRSPYVSAGHDPAAPAGAAGASHGPQGAAASGSAEDRLRDAAAAGEQRLRETGEEARVVAERAMDHVREYTKENPLAAAGIAFAAGVILSRLLSR